MYKQNSSSQSSPLATSTTILYYLLALLLLTGSIGCWPAVAPFADPALEEELLYLINQQRQAHGYAVLIMEPHLRYLARRYSYWMMAANFFAHTDPHGDKVAQRLANAGVPFWKAAENLAWVRHFTSTPAPAVLQAWLQSPHHRRNLLAFSSSSPLPTGLGVITDGAGSYTITHILIQPHDLLPLSLHIQR